MPGRKYDNGSKYRYGFNGKENDKDISEGEQDYGMRIYDGRLGRFLSVDPLSNKYPMLTPYQFSSNTPIWAIDLDGLEAVIKTPDFLTNNLINEFFNDHLLTSGGKEFTKVLNNQTSYDVVYTTFNPESWLAFKVDGNLYKGESGETFTIPISNMVMLHYYRDELRTPMLQNVKDEDVERTFHDNKKIIVIAINATYGSERVKNLIAQHPNAKDNINLNGSHAMNHEETAHALRKLIPSVIIGPPENRVPNQDHKDYQNSDSQDSPDVTELDPQTKAGQNVKELKQIIKAKNNSREDRAHEENH